jgi:hypothetical protein
MRIKQSYQGALTKQLRTRTLAVWVVQMRHA